MKVIKTATFRFKFNNISSKEKSYEMLKQFLSDNKWTDQTGRKLLPLDNFNTDSCGVCEIVLAEEAITEDFKDLIDELFESLVSKDDIKWVSTYYNKATSKIVHNEAGKYLKQQKVQIQDMVYGDEMVVCFKK